MNTLSRLSSQSAFKYALILLLFVGLVGCKGNTSVSVNGETYTSEMTKKDKKKYYDANKNVVYEVKYKDDGFKLRRASSALIWKIKLYDEKIKISDNEENLNPYEIKMLENNEAKLEYNDEVLARTTGDAVELVKTIEVMPADQQEIIISELKAKGY